MSDEVYVICEVTGKKVLPCWCGTHELCPEHILNCLNDWSDEEVFAELDRVNDARAYRAALS